MTMQHKIHPDDERLAALAGGDPELASDAELGAHVSGCDSCRATIDELTTLRAALAELPDMVPSRRLQLLPPVADPRAANSGGWLRRLSAPIMAMGLGLVLVGAVGTSGLLTNFASSGSSAGQVFAPVGNSGQDALEGAGSAAHAATPGLPLNLGSFGARSGGSLPTAASEDTAASGGPSSSPAAAQKSAVPTDSGRVLLSLDGDQPTSPWLALLFAGFAFVIAGGVLRLAVRPN
jgi:hypothetical protein